MDEGKKHEFLGTHGIESSGETTAVTGVYYAVLALKNWVRNGKTVYELIDFWFKHRSDAAFCCCWMVLEEKIRDATVLSKAGMSKTRPVST
ncbi:hypothetical protein TNCV_3272051 [Trichonephila clavipes]|nr:hypothetical protein TNCV_3272051 [Trichonephila clavipes]